MTFQERIKQAFAEAAARMSDAKQPRLTKTDLWKAAGASSGAASHWFNGSNGADFATCMKIGPILGVNPQWLYDGTGPKQISIGLLQQSAASDQPKPWPFPSLPEDQVRALPPGDLKALEGALALAIAQLRLKVRVVPIEEPAAPAKGLPRLEDIDEPFPYIPQKPMPWEIEPEPRQRKEPEPLRISTVANVGHVPHAGYSANDHEFVPIPELDVRLAAGKLGIENYEETEIGEILLRRSFLESFGLPVDRMKIVYAEGDSMEPVIRNGGPMLFFEDVITDRHQIDSRTVYAINYGGKMVVKCLSRARDGVWMARSLNPAHKDFPLVADDGSDVRIVGRILWSPYDLRNGVDERLVRR